MPPLPVIPDVYRCALNWSTGSGQIAVNVLHVLDLTGSKTTADIALDIRSSFASGQFETVSSSASCSSIDVLPLDGTTPTAHEAITPQTGGGGAEWIPGYALLVNLQTPVRGRSYRGRMFVPFTAETKQNDGQVAVTSFSALQAAWSNFQGFLVGNGCELGVASYKLGAFTYPVTLNVHDTYNTLRPRQKRVV